MSAFEILQSLQTEVGPRRAGTPGELRAQAWLKARCEALGLPVELDEFKYIGSPAYRPLVSLLTLILITTGVVLMVSDQFVLGLIPFTLLFIYFNFIAKNIELRLAKTSSHNVIAGLRRPITEYMADPQKGPAILICAHYDTPHNLTPWLSPLRDLLRFFAPLGLLSLVLLAAAWALQLLCLILGSESCREFIGNIASILGYATLILNAPYYAYMLLSSLVNLLGKKTDAPGADDNGSGTALVLEVARRMQQNPPANTEIFFAFWGAEERGLFGSRQFVRRFGAQLDRHNFYIINADCVGVGRTLTIHTGQGTWQHHPTDPRTIARVERLAAHFNIPTARSWESIISGGSSDHAAWVDR
ncbi:MAG TPA: M20/M25/M40 family metallo-hydrolase, partial [Anaerolineaceae bacterium]|nr:M20/M25/M40 family metallo-hydrolase [Anaerolineaceae bacterium]